MRTVLCFCAYKVCEINQATHKVRPMNDKARPAVIRAKTASKPRALRPIICSAPPEIAPDRPALLLDCSRTTKIKAIATMTSKIFANVNI